MNSANAHHRVPLIPDGVAWRAYDGEILVVTSQDAQVRTLSEVGSFAFERFDGQATLQSVAQAIIGEFDVLKLKTGTVLPGDELIIDNKKIGTIVSVANHNIFAKLNINFVKEFRERNDVLVINDNLVLDFLN